MSRLSTEAGNFGPISTARIDLSPLTIFVGANNTGKSYMAQLIYAINRTFAYSTLSESIVDFRYVDLTDRYYHYLPHRKSLEQFLNNKEALRTLATLLSKNYYDAVRGERTARIELPFDKLPDVLKNLINDEVGEFLERAIIPLRSNIQDCFGTKLMNLVGKFSNDDKFHIKISSRSPFVEISIDCEKGNLTLKKKKISLSGQVLRPWIGRGMMRSAGSDMGTNVVDAINYRLAAAIIESGVRVVTDVFPNQAYYLPAARSGILSGQKLIARAGLQSLKYGGIKTISMRKMSGSMVDFIDAIYSIDKQTHAGTYDLAREFEQKILMGTINLKEYKPELPEIYFQENVVGKVELHRSSSMIAEMAAIILILKYLLQKGEIIIIEEPESHLHPGAQLEFAKLCIRLANRGVYVLLTTHSDYFLQKIANLIAMHNKTNDELGRKGYRRDEVINPAQVKAYLFKRDLQQKGSWVKSLPVTDKGISTESFNEVAEQLYEESLST